MTRLTGGQTPCEHGLGRNGGQLFNKINSISPRYWDKLGITLKLNF